MYRKIYFVAAVLLLAVLHGYSQQPNVSKGYYSIGRNADKLNKGHVLTMIKTEGRFPPAAKGYYSIGDKQKKTVSYVPVLKNTDKPRVNKGYQSINSFERTERP